MDPAYMMLLNIDVVFSPQTYGESTLVLVSKLIDECDLHGRGFVDLGSGVGQVCMMVAALSSASRLVFLSCIVLLAT
jgi:hypothetical protein